MPNQGELSTIAGCSCSLGKPPFVSLRFAQALLGSVNTLIHEVLGEKASTVRVISPGTCLTLAAHERRLAIAEAAEHSAGAPPRSVHGGHRSLCQRLVTLAQLLTLDITCWTPVPSAADLALQEYLGTLIGDHLWGSDVSMVVVLLTDGAALKMDSDGGSHYALLAAVRQDGLFPEASYYDSLPQRPLLSRARTLCGLLLPDAQVVTRTCPCHGSRNDCGLHVALNTAMLVARLRGALGIPRWQWPSHIHFDIGRDMVLPRQAEWLRRAMAREFLEAGQLPLDSWTSELVCRVGYYIAARLTLSS